ncbi:MAG: hypothetical protein ACLPSH_04285 [Vulcanimicrobiaceae bacterium]
MDDPSKGGDLTASRDARVQRRLRQQLEESLAHLGFARRLREESRRDLSIIDAVIKQSNDELGASCIDDEGRIVPRRRPKSEDRGDRYILYVDECGNHALNAKESFTAFSLSAVLVHERDLVRLEETWGAWKKEYLGSEAKVVHEPDIRGKTKSFYCGGDSNRQNAAVESLDKCIRGLPFTGFVCIIEREKFVARFGKDSVDTSLPRHSYLLTVNFLAERVALAIDTQLGGGKARWVIESRGPKEDAAFQYEFARLFLDGTAYLAPHFFRKLFLPGLTFLGKGDCSAGLQLADMQARPCAEKVMRPVTTPARWETFRDKLCRGKETGHSILGLKILPWDEAYERLWESERDHLRDP